jgi:hypothetical protein
MPKKWLSSFQKLIEKYQNYFIWGIVIFVLLIGLCFKSSNIILCITALIILWYTLETYWMRKAISENTEISTRPILILHIDLNFLDTKVSISIENFGNFPAYNVCFEQTELETKKSSLDIQSKSFRFMFENVDVVPPKGRVEIAFESLELPDNSLFGLLHNQRSCKLPYYLETIAMYEDILGRIWKTNLGYSSQGIIAGKPEFLERRRTLKL